MQSEVTSGRFSRIRYSIVQKYAPIVMPKTALVIKSVIKNVKSDISNSSGVCNMLLLR